MLKYINYNLSRIIQLTTLCFIIIFNYACKKEIIPPQAEITNIYNITDSSANVDVKVTKQSNAEYGDLDLIVDSTSISGSKTQVQFIYFSPSSVT